MCPFIIPSSGWVVSSHDWRSFTEFCPSYVFPEGMHHMQHFCLHRFTGYIPNTLLGGMNSHACSPCTDSIFYTLAGMNTFSTFGFSVDIIPTTLCTGSMYRY